jgi:hypothetical protein
MNTPLTYKEQATLSLFIILLIPTCLIFGAGVIPTLTIFVGILYAKAEKDFGYLETAFKVVQYYTMLFAIVLGSVATISSFSMHSSRSDSLLTLLVDVGIPAIYLFGFNYAVVAPLRYHQTWVVNQGIFLNKERTETFRNTPLISFGKTALIADELLKLNNLKEANLVTLEEFDSLRSKLLR